MWWEIELTKLFLAMKINELGVMEWFFFNWNVLTEWFVDLVRRLQIIVVVEIVQNVFLILAISFRDLVFLCTVLCSSTLSTREMDKTCTHRALTHVFSTNYGFTPSMWWQKDNSPSRTKICLRTDTSIALIIQNLIIWTKILTRKLISIW